MANNGMEWNEMHTPPTDRMKNISLSRCFPKRNAARCKTNRVDSVDISKGTGGFLFCGVFGGLGTGNWKSLGQ